MIRTVFPADVAELAAGEISRLELSGLSRFPMLFERVPNQLLAVNLYFGSPERSMQWIWKRGVRCSLSFRWWTAVVLAAGSTNPRRFGDILAKLYAVNALTGELVAG